jgi:hypothetical protein
LPGGKEIGPVRPSALARQPATQTKGP